MIKLKRLLIVFCLFAFHANSQILFNNLVESGALDNQSRLFNVYHDSNLIFTIGDLMDTTIDSLNPQVRPWFGIFNNQGELVHKRILYHEDINGSMVFFGSRLLTNIDGNFLYNTIVAENEISKSIIIEIDSEDGSILRHRVYNHPNNSDDYILPGWIAFTDQESHNLIIENEIEIDGKIRSYILIIDPDFNILKEIIVDDNGRNNYPFFIELEPDSTIILVGESWKRNDVNSITEVKPFLMEVNLYGEILSFTLGEGINTNTVLFSPSNSYNVLKDSNDNWIISANSLVPIASCFGCYYHLPFSFSYSRDFSVFNWATSLSDDVSDQAQKHALFASEIDYTYRSIFITGSKLNAEERNAYIVKLDSNGDSIWTRHLIPLSWDSSEIAWAHLRDIEMTSDGSFLAVGYASNLQEGLWRSWIIHLDSNGCFVPGCQNIVSTADNKGLSKKYFNVYPNPTSSFLGLTPNTEFKTSVLVSLLDMNGVFVHSLHFDSRMGYQYLIDISALPGGMYILNISTDGQMLQSEKIIIN